MRKRKDIYIADLTKELTLCEKRLQERTREVKQADPGSLEYDILLMEIELLGMLVDELQKKVNQNIHLALSDKTRKSIFSIKPTIN